MGIENAETGGREQRGIERRPQDQRAAGNLHETLARQQVPGDSDVIYGIPVQRYAVGELPRPDEAPAQRAEGDQQQRIAIQAEPRAHSRLHPLGDSDNASRAACAWPAERAGRASSNPAAQDAAYETAGLPWADRTGYPWRWRTGLTDTGFVPAAGAWRQDAAAQRVTQPKAVGPATQAGIPARDLTLRSPTGTNARGTRHARPASPRPSPPRRVGCRVPDPGRPAAKAAPACIRTAPCRCTTTPTDTAIQCECDAPGGSGRAEARRRLFVIVQAIIRQAQVRLRLASYK